MLLTAAEVYRDFVTDGVPSSSWHDPKKPEIRRLLAQYEQAISAYTTNANSISKMTKAELDSALNHGNDVMAWVYGDPTVANNGIYRKVGASGSGYWGKILPLPFSFIIASDIGAGTPNAIQATTALPVSESALIFMNVFEPNTGSPVTVSFNGGSALTIKSNSGGDVAVGGLRSGMVVLGRISGSTFRLVNDETIASLIFAARDQTFGARDDAQEARDDAEAARDVVSGLASAFIIAENTFATKATAEAWHPVAAPDYIRTAGYSSAGDGGGAVYKKVASEPAHAGKLSITLSDGVSVVWYELPSIVADPMAFSMGVYVNDGVSRPLSMYFGTLTEAQAVYPHATALTDELAWAACQAAVTVLEQNRFGGSVSYGGTLQLPRGTLNFGSNTLRIKNNYVNVAGAPYQGTRINRSATTGYAIHFAKEAVENLFYVGLSNVQITSTVAMTGGGLVFFDIANFSMIRDCRLVNGFINLHCRSVHDFHIENVNGVHGAPYPTGNSAFANLYLDAQTAAGSYNPNNNGWISNCNFRSFTTDAGYTTHGVYISSADGLWFDHCHIGNGETANLTIIPKTSTTQLSGVTMSNCWFDQGGNGRMVNIGGATSGTFGYFQFADCYLTGGTSCTDGWRIDPTTGTVVRHVEITGGKVMNLKGHGLIANRLEGLVMSGVQIRNVGTAGSGGTGMTFGATCKNLTITGVAAGYAGNLSTAALSPYGIVVAAGVNEYIITGCNLRGNATGGISDGGGPNKVVANNLV